MADSDDVKFYKKMGYSQELAEATALQRGVIKDERELLENGNADYADAQVSQSIVHTRQDLVLIISHVYQLNRKGNKLIRRLNAIIVLLGLLIIILMLRT